VEKYKFLLFNSLLYVDKRCTKANIIGLDELA